jgi:hypothetical protein
MSEYISLKNSLGDSLVIVVVLSLNAKFSRIRTPSTSKDLKEWPSLPSQGKVVTREDGIVVSLS